MKFSFLLTLLTATLSSLPVNSFALDLGKSCVEDQNRYCSKLLPSHYENCLWQNYSKLAPVCKALFEPGYKQWPCNVDAAVFCKGVASPNYLEGCLWTHYANLNPECKKRYEPLVRQNPCLPDTGKFCRGFADSEIDSCLWTHYEELSGDCKRKYSPKYAEWPCNVDAAKFCRRTDKPGASADVCFSNHMDLLSADCRNRILKSGK